MQTKTLPYLLGLIKWTNMFTVLYWQIQIYNYLFGNWIISLGIAFMTTQLLFNVVIGGWLERKFGKDNMIDNNIIFKIISTIIAVSIAIMVLVVYQAYTVFVTMIVLVIIYTAVLALISKAKQKNGESHVQRGGF